MTNFPFKTAKILIVDDEQANIDVLSGLLDIQGYTNYYTATDPAEVMRMVKELNPDLILLDLMMEPIDGFEVMKQLKIRYSRFAYLPILVLTADITSKSKQQALAGGAHDFLTKPFDLVEVGLRIKNLLEYRFLILEQEMMNQKLEARVMERTLELQRMNKDLLLAKEKAEASERLKTSFLQNLSHEIRTPMNGIMGFIQLMKMDDITAEDKIFYLHIIEKSSKRLLNLMLDLVDISRIETEQIDISRELVMINEVLTELHFDFQEEANDKGLELKLGNMPADYHGILTTDLGKFKQIFGHLIRNAIKFTLKGDVEFGYEIQDNDILFYVNDTGIGVKSEQNELIYERFRQGDEGVSRGYEGTGLGLSVAKAFVDKLGGRIGHSPNSPQGTIFWFSLPRESDSESQSDGKETSLNSSFTGKLKILVVDDDLTSRQYLTYLLKESDHLVFTAGDGVEAVETMKLYPAMDLILMDARMPEMDGYEATARIREINKNVVIIFQSAYTEKVNQELAIHAGCNAFLNKPVDSNELLYLMKKLIPS